MRKADIAEIICETAGVQKTDSMELLEKVLDIIKSMLQKGEVVKIAGFGNFVVRSKGERKGRNPRTGEEIAITPRRVVTFRPSQLLKKHVNS
jgi:integration host factor subunit alpha